MVRPGFALSVLCLAAAPVFAADSSASSSDAGSSDSAGEAVPMAKLIDQGYEIKSAVPSGTGKLIVFVQKEKSAYACEFVNTANTQCRPIN